MRHEPDDDLLTRGYAVTHPSGSVVLPTEPGWSQLLYAASGVMRVEAGAEVWVVPPHRALWLPDGSQARIVMHGRVSVRTLYLRDPSVLPPATVSVDVSPLLRELVLHAVRTSPLLRDCGEHRRLVATIGDQLAAAPHTPLQLPAPVDPRAVALALAFETDLATRVPLERLAARAGASRRTLERLFLADTRMTIGQWRQRLRLVRALEMLAAGDPVTVVATAVGYTTPSAFTAMFRAQLGAPPGRYLGPGSPAPVRPSAEIGGTRFSPGRRGASAADRPR